MLNEEVLIEYAIKGIEADIAAIEKSIRKGELLLKAYEKGIVPNTTKTPAEIEEHILDKKEEVERLKKLMFDLDWEISIK